MRSGHGGQHTVWIQVNSGAFVPLSVEDGSSRRTMQAHPVQPPHPTPVHPAPDFRQNLHRALEVTHRQQMAQRQLGTHAPVDWREIEQTQEAQSLAWSTALLLMGLSLLWFLLGKQRRP